MPVRRPVSRLTGRVPSVVRLAAGATVAVAVFLFAVQLLGAATDAAAPTLRRVLAAVVRGDTAALGLSWLGAYVVGNGSVVAALALSLFKTGLVSTAQLYLLIAGSRLGAAAIVLFIGALDFLQKDRYSLQEGVSMGLLTFLVTHSIYIPATVVGYLLLPVVVRPVERGDVPDIEAGVFGVSPSTGEAITDSLGALPAFLVAVALLFGSLQLFDRVLGRVETATLRDRFFRHFERRWLSFALGLVITTVTTSVAFSLGVIVPLYNREYVKRDELVPYVLGANIGTLFDALVVALVLPTAVGATAVLLLLGLSTAVTVVALASHRRYIAAIERIDDRLVDDWRVFVAFVVLLLVVPLGLIVIPLAAG